MKTVTIILGILLFAIVTAILYLIGLKKKMEEEEALAKKLMNNASLKVIEYLKVNKEASLHEIETLIKDVKAKNFYSGNTALIMDSKEFKYRLLDFMVKNNYLLEKKDQNGKKVYTLKNQK